MTKIKRKGRPPKMKDGISVSIVLPQKHVEYLKTQCRYMSTQEKRQVTLSEAIRLSVEKCYPMPKQFDMFEEDK